MTVDFAVPEVRDEVPNAFDAAISRAAARRAARGRRHAAKAAKRAAAIADTGARRGFASARSTDVLDTATDRAMERLGAAWEDLARSERLDAIIAELGRIGQERDVPAAVRDEVEAAMLVEIDAGLERLGRGIAKTRATMDRLLETMNVKTA